MGHYRTTFPSQYFRPVPPKLNAVLFFVYGVVLPGGSIKCPSNTVKPGHAAYQEYNAGDVHLSNFIGCFTSISTVSVQSRNVKFTQRALCCLLKAVAGCCRRRRCATYCSHGRAWLSIWQSARPLKFSSATRMM